MQYTQFLIFEVGKGCNLAEKHKRCPSSHPDRFGDQKKFGPMPDDLIVNTACEAMDKGFSGLIGFHYYNEPLLYLDRIEKLVGEIKEKKPEARFVLWTNGHLFPEDISRLKIFNKAWVTNYDGGDYSRIRKAIPDCTEVKWNLDGRSEKQGGRNRTPCGRIFSELTFDYYGEAHLCCIDWRNECKIGNLHSHSFKTVLSRFQDIRRTIMNGVTEDAPTLCKKCTMGHKRISDLVPEIAEKARKYLQNSNKTVKHVKNRNLLILAYGNPDRGWKQRHARYGRIVVCGNDAELWRACRKANEEWVTIIRPDQTICGEITDDIDTEADIIDVDGLKIIRRTTVSRIRHGDLVAPNATKISTTKSSYVESKVKYLPDIRPAVTFTHYNLPYERLKQHFEWNDGQYRNANVRVFVVTDRDHPVPEYVTCLIYPDKMPKFNLSATSNYGIRYAIDSGFNVIIKTDVDVNFTDTSFNACLSVSPGKGVIPIYRMSNDYDCTTYVEAPKATGTVSMVSSDWFKAHYDERCVGYGCDDAVVMKAMEKSGINLNRNSFIWHMPHIENTPQKEFDRKNPRIDHWGRNEGFNPENFAENRQWVGAENNDPNWGLAGCDSMTIVVTHYSIPEKRLTDFVRWNGDNFRQNRIRCIIVSDVNRFDFESNIRVAKYPVRMDKFSLSKTSNYGIRLAGSGIICKSDIDCVFESNIIKQIMNAKEGNGFCPQYHMAPSYRLRNQGEIWDQSKGTMCLVWEDWDKISGYDERMYFYGVEDGAAYESAKRIATIHRDGTPIIHVAHDENAPQMRGQRSDQWGRDSGQNPKNHSYNRRVGQTKWYSDQWGMP